MAKPKKKSKSKKPSSSSESHKSKSEKPCIIANFIVMPVMPVYVLNEKLRTGKITYNELWMTARMYAINASDLWSENKHEEGLQIALAAMTLYIGLKEANYPFLPNEPEFIKLADDVINQHKLSKNKA